jgi:hypothetical protein
MTTLVPWPRAVTWLFLLIGLAAVGLGVYSFSVSGPSATPELIWGSRGVQDGCLVRPRAIAIDRDDTIYIVDFTARIQVFDREGHYLGPTWTTPDFKSGRPSGLSIARDGKLIVSDSHYNSVKIYNRDGKIDREFGGEAGTAPGQLGYVSDVVQDDKGDFFVAEFGENQRISHFENNGRFVKCWGSQGVEPGQFNRIRALALGPDGLLYAADACNHRLQVFTRAGQLVRVIGEAGSEPGQFLYPYDVAFAHDKEYRPIGDLYVVEYGNNRVQKLTLEGRSLGVWGSAGAEPGKLHSPWALAIDSHGGVHVVDTDNHRVQRIAF